MSASPASIAAGGSSVLTLTAANATAVTVKGSDGSSYTLQPAGGTQTVTPSATTTYTATATSSGGNATATAMVTVAAAGSPVPTVTLAANPTTINAGSSAVLTAVATNATSVTITGTDGTTYTLQSTGGTQTVSPGVSTTYTATATGTGGTVTATAAITVVPQTAPPAPTVTIAANPASIGAGASSVLTVSATNATAVTVTGNDGSSYTLQPTGGTQTVTPAATTIYTATATGAGGSVTATATVTVVPPAPPMPTVTISANPASVVQGNASVLTVTATNDTAVTVTGSDGSSYNLQPAGGTQSVTPTATTTYTATATGAGGTITATATVTVTAPSSPGFLFYATPTSIMSGNSSILTVKANSTASVLVSGSDGSSYNLQPNGGTQSVSPAATTTYTATASVNGSTLTTTATVTVVTQSQLQSVQHVVFMLQENHSFDNYLGMLNDYRATNGYTEGADGVTYAVDGIDDKLQMPYTKNSSDPDTNGQVKTYSLFKMASTCIEDLTSSWLESYGQVNRYDFATARPALMDGFIHTAQNYATDCANSGGTNCAGTFPDTTGQWAMGYYDQKFLNYYYYMASKFALSDRWFSPVSSKSTPNRIATLTGGTTQGLVFDPGVDDHLGQLGTPPDDTTTPSIFEELDNAGVKWKIYYTVTQGACSDPDDCGTTVAADYPATDFTYLAYSQKYINQNASCVAPTVPSGSLTNIYSASGFCIDPNHIAPLSQYFTDVANNQLPQFAFIEAGYGINDEHPGAEGSDVQKSILVGQQEVAQIIDSLTTSPSWPSSVFFFAYDEGGGPYDHVPPVPGKSNQNTDVMVGDEPSAAIPDISSIAVMPDVYGPCVPPVGTTTQDAIAYHCDLDSSDPGATTGDAAQAQGFAAQLGFRVPNMVISPFTRAHYVSHIPMDHTAVIKFVESRFIGPTANLTMRDAAQPNLLDFFDFANTPWATPPPQITPYTDGGASCNPTGYASGTVIPGVSITANPTTVTTGGSSILTVTATNATTVTVTGSDNSSYTLSPGGGQLTVTPAATTVYTAIATGTNASASEPVTVTVQ